jgi:YidC/Oxa1 family membrane protein insertase
MITTVWNQLLVFPLTNSLIFLYQLFGNNLGWAIIALTIAIKIITLPLSIPSIQTAKKQRELAPELSKIKERYKNDKKKQMEAQATFLKEHGLNPSSGCLLQILTLVVIFALYQVFMNVLNVNGHSTLNEILYPFLQFKSTSPLNVYFGYLNLIEPDPYFVLPILAGVFQFLLSKLMMPVVSKEERLARKTPEKSDDLMYNMQEQSLYLMPVMTVLIGWKLASGLVLYWLLSSLLQLLQQLIADGHMLRWARKVGKYAGKA